jgi:hypothetical protein
MVSRPEWCFGLNHRLVVMKKWFILLVAVISLTVMSSVDAVTLSVDSGSGKLGTGQHQISIHLTNDMPVRGIQLKMADIPIFSQQTRWLSPAARKIFLSVFRIHWDF